MQGFIFNYSLGGGTGSGLGSMLLEKVNLDYAKKTKLDFILFPAKDISVSITEPYNTVLGIHAMSENTNCSFSIDNQACYDICHKYLGVEHCTYLNINRIIAQTISSLTLSLRFGGELNGDLRDIHTNLVPFKSLHYATCANAPLLTQDRANYEKTTVKEVTLACFEPQSQMMKYDPRKGKYMACCMLYRGDVVPKEVNEALSIIKAKRTIQFVDWCPTQFKVGIN